MLKTISAAVVASLLTLSPVLAADPAAAPAPAVPASPFDIAFGFKLMSDYNFRGITQSDRAPSANAYVEFKYDWLYAGISAYRTDLATKPLAEIDLYAGIRPVIGPLSFDFGVIYYYYPNEEQLVVAGVPFTPRNTDFFEGMAKVSYTWNETVTLGANLFASPNYLNTGAYGTYASLTGKIALPMDFAVSGELGRYWLGRTDLYLGAIDLKDYTYWNAGVSWSYKNVVTLDLRYHDTDLGKANCFLITSDPGGIVSGRSKWCSAAFVATLSIDTSWSALR